MSSPDEEEKKEEIIIVKRGGGDGDGHHGGAWKIAFADFMTAMMALFLVLWLVNAANEDMKKSVASYFNPVKLVERNRSSKGLDSSVEASMKESESEDDNTASEESSASESESAPITDTAFFEDPFKVLDAIAEEESSELIESIDAPESSGGAPAEDSFLDPFAQPESNGDPSDFEGTGDANASPENQAKGPDELAKAQTPRGESLLAEGTEVQEEFKENDGDMAPGLAPKTMSPDTTEPSEAEQTEEPKTMAAEMGEPVDAQDEQEAKQEAEPENAEQAREQKLKELSDEIGDEIRMALKRSLGSDEQISESLTVEVTKDGVLISITDQFGFSMFRLGSAVPQGELVLAMAEISKILADRPGMVRVYGHTDGKPYVGNNYDNWRLSTARAHSARLMLTRGGLDQVRVSQVVGFADRKLKEPERPEDESNRRIEILLEVS